MVGDGGDFGLNLRGLLPGPTTAICTDRARRGTLTSKQISSGHTAEHEGKEVGSPSEWRGGARLYSQVIVGESGLETC